MSACEQLTGVVGTNIWERLTTSGKDHRALSGAAGSEAATRTVSPSPRNAWGDYRGAVRLHQSSNFNFYFYLLGISDGKKIQSVNKHGNV